MCGSVFSYALRDADLYAPTFPSDEFLPLCKSRAWDEMTPDDLHRSRQGKLKSLFPVYFFFLSAIAFFSFSACEGVHSTLRWNETRRAARSSSYFKETTTWDDTIQSIFTSRYIHHVGPVERSSVHYLVGTFLKPDLHHSISTFILQSFNLLNGFWVNKWFNCVRTNHAHNTGSSRS